jgi:iron complex outermembrane receptor protein
MFLDMRLLSITALLFAVTAQAQKIDTLPKVAVEAVRGTPTTPISQTTLTKSDLTDKNFGQDMPFLLATTPSITVVSDGGGYNGYQYMRLRGIDQTRINMTLNGVPLNEPEDQGAYFSNFADFTASMQSVQVQRGVGTSSNGTASFGGSVNFESINPFEPHRAIEFSPNFMKAVEAGVVIGRTGVYARHTNQDITGFRDHSGNSSKSTYFTSLSVFDRTSLRLTGMQGTSDNQMAYLASSLAAIRINPRDNPLSEDETDHFAQNFLSGEVTRQLAPDHSLSLTGYWNTLQGYYGVNIPDAQLKFGLQSSWKGALVTYRFTGERVRVDLGGHANSYRRYHSLDDGAAYSNHGDKTEQSVFAKVDYAVTRRLNLIADAQVRFTGFEYFPSDNSPVDGSVDWRFFNPKIGVTFRPSPVSKVYASYGENSREPTRTDLLGGADDIDNTNRADIVPFTRVRPERVRDVEIGGEHRASDYAISGNVYVMSFHDEIAPIGKLSFLGLPLRKNVDRSYRTGVELDGLVKPTEKLTVTTNFSVSRNRIAEYTDDASGKTYHNVRPYLTPEVLANTQWTYALSSVLGVYFAERYVGPSQLDNTESQFIVPSAALLDVGTNVALGPLFVGVRVTNLFNKLTYAGGYTDGVQPYYFVQQTRNWTLNARLNF